MEKFKRLLEEEKKRDWIVRHYQLLDETKFSRVVIDYFEKGFIIVSSDRQCAAELGRECSTEELQAQEQKNKQNEKTIRKDFTQGGYGFVPTYGGYREKITSANGTVTYAEKPTLEKSFIVADKYDNIARLEQLGLSLVRKYNQDSFLLKPPDKADINSYLIDQNGLRFATFKGKTVSDLTQEYYTYLRKESPVKRLSLKEWVHWAPNSPNSATEAFSRYGEVFIKFSY